MATTTKKRPNISNPKTRSPSLKAANARLRREIKELRRQLTEALEQQTATSEILGVIAGSATDIQPVLDVVAKSAARLCDANDAQIYRVEGELIRKVASYGSVPSHLPIGEHVDCTADPGWAELGARILLSEMMG